MVERFSRHVVVLPPRGARAYDAEDWRDALVVVTRGTVELECRSGSRQRFAAGAVLWLAGLPLRRLRSPDGRPAVLVAVRRVQER